MAVFTISLEQAEKAVMQFYNEANIKMAGGPLQAVEIQVCKPFSLKAGDPIDLTIDIIRIERKSFF